MLGLQHYSVFIDTIFNLHYCLTRGCKCFRHQRDRPGHPSSYHFPGHLSLSGRVASPDPPADGLPSDRHVSAQLGFVLIIIDKHSQAVTRLRR